MSMNPLALVSYHDPLLVVCRERGPYSMHAPALVASAAADRQRADSVADLMMVQENASVGAERRVAIARSSA